MEVLLSYESDNVVVPDAGEDPNPTDHQFFFRPFEEGNAPSDANPFEGLDFDGEPANPKALGVGETGVFDLVVAPGGELEQDQDYTVDVTITANLEGN